MNYKKTASIILIPVISLLMYGCSNDKVSTTKDENKTINTELVNLDNLNTYDDVKVAYKQYFEKIHNKESIRDLDINTITIDTVKEYADKALKITGDLKGTDKIDTISKIVDLNDLVNHTSQEVLEDALRYMVGQYESNKLKDNLDVNYYIVRYAQKRLMNHTDWTYENKMIEDMEQVLKDNIREDDSRMESNIEQINEVISFVKERLY